MTSEPTRDTEREARLTAAYHAVYDVKDTLSHGSDEFCDAADAIRAIGRLLADLGCFVPHRVDAERS